MASKLAVTKRGAAKLLDLDSPRAFDNAATVLGIKPIEGFANQGMDGGVVLAVLDGLDDVRDVGILRLPQGSGDADADGVRGLENAEVGGRPQLPLLDELLQFPAVDVGDMRDAAVDALHLRFVHFDAGDGEARRDSLCARSCAIR